MNRTDFDAYRSASPVRRRALMGKLLADNEERIARACEYNLQRTQFHIAHLREDAMQAARIGFMRAVDEWSPDRGRFWVVAYGWIRHEIQQVLERAAPITHPRKADLPRRAQDAAAAFYAKNGREPTPAEIGVTASDVRRAQAAQTSFVSISHADQVAVVAEEGPEEGLDRTRSLRALREFARGLSPKEKKRLATGTDGEMNARAAEFVRKERGR